MQWHYNYPVHPDQPLCTGWYKIVVTKNRCINALAEVNGDAAYINAINAINTLIDRQRAIMAACKTNNAKKKEEKPGENPDEKPDEL